MTITRTLSLPTIDLVEIVDLHGINPNRVDQCMAIAKHAPCVRLVGASAERVAALWRQLPPGNQARCHLPPYGLRFFANEQLVCEASVCWECDNIYGHLGSDHFCYEFDSSQAASIELWKECQRAFGRTAEVISIVRTYVNAFNLGDIDTLRSLFTPDAIIHGVLGTVPIGDALLVWHELHAAFNIVLTVDAVTVEGNQIAVRYIESGVFTHTFRGQQPTGRRYELVAMECFELRDGLISIRWGARDSAAQARQIGLSL